MLTQNSFMGLCTLVVAPIIISIFVNEAQVKGVDNVREAVFNHFSTRFQSGDINHPGMENLSFKTLSVSQGWDMIITFSIEEVNHVVWD